MEKVYQNDSKLTKDQQASIYDLKEECHEAFILGDEKVAY